MCAFESLRTFFFEFFSFEFYYLGFISLRTRGRRAFRSSHEDEEEDKEVDFAKKKRKTILFCRTTDTQNERRAICRRKRRRRRKSRRVREKKKKKKKKKFFGRRGRERDKCPSKWEEEPKTKMKKSNEGVRTSCFFLRDTRRRPRRRRGVRRGDLAASKEGACERISERRGTWRKPPPPPRKRRPWTRPRPSKRSPTRSQHHSRAGTVIDGSSGQARSSALHALHSSRLPRGPRSRASSRRWPAGRASRSAASAGRRATRCVHTNLPFESQTNQLINTSSCTVE